LGISEAEVIKNVMLKETVDGEFTTVADVAETAVFFAGFESNALTGQSLVGSHGWFMQGARARPAKRLDAATQEALPEVEAPCAERARAQFLQKYFSRGAGQTRRPQEI